MFRGKINRIYRTHLLFKLAVTSIQYRNIVAKWYHRWGRDKLFAPKSSVLHSTICSAAMLVILNLSMPGNCHAETFVVSAPSSVEDTVLRDREFARWNFGNGHVLEAGYMPGLYELHHGVSLIRFRLSQLPCRNVVSATLRLHKPKSYSQMVPVQVSVYQIRSANADWVEGSSLCSEEHAASTWNQRTSGKGWAGASGCSDRGVDYVLPALDTQTASSDIGQWLEFTIPAGLVQSWLDEPQNNAGLCIRADDNARLGEHAFFYSSEHYSGNGPQLVIEAASGPSRQTESPGSFNPRYVFPPEGDAFEKWLKEANNRYTNWANDPQMNMTRRQALMIYYFDVTVRGEFLCPRVRIPLTENMLQLDSLIAEGDAPALRQKLADVWKYLLVWEYIRETRWYDAGPLADVLSPLQLAILWAKPGYGIFAKMDDGRWDPLSPEELERNIQETISQTQSKLNLTPKQLELIEPLIREYETREHYYISNLRKDLDEIYGLIAAGNNGPEIFESVKRLHFDHELFLYYQSTFSGPRWKVFFEHANPVSLAREYQRVRRKEYNPGRTARQVQHARQYVGP